MSLRSGTGAEPAIEQRLHLILRQFLTELGAAHAARSLTPGSSLERDLGLGSLERVELLARLEREFGVSLADSAVAEAETAADLLRALQSSGGRREPERPGAVVEALAAAATPESATNLLEALYIHSQADPARPHIHLRQEDGSEQTIMYGALSDRACRVAAELARRGVEPGDRVALMLPTGQEFFYSFMGVLLAQAIPVPIYPPFRADRIEDFATRQAGILRNAEARLLITVRRGEALARLLRPAAPSLADVVSAERLGEEGFPGSPAPWPAVRGGGERPALIQYTSGSTSDPKGVLLTHANLLANIRAIGAAIEVRPTDIAVSWLPLYHDMGLIGSWLLSLYYAIPITILSPLAFLSRPERWLWAIHYHRATLSVGPNFGYDLCARKIRDEALEGLDLSCWRVALNGSETVRPETLERFAARFARYGFRPEVMLPVYGLAESSVGLSFPPLRRPPRVDRIRRETFERARRAEPAHGSEAASAFVSVGGPLPDHEVRLVDAAGQQVGERIEGRLQFRGPSSMAGYYHQPEATAAVTTSDGWLDSGDLAYRAGGELFITGRAKDMILKAGRNLYPQEIEAAVAETDGIRRGCVAAFGISDPGQGTEKLVVVAETRQQDAEARDRLRAAVSSRLLELLGVPPDDVVLLSPGLLPKTSSGKLRRTACRQLYEQGELSAGRPPMLVQWARLAAAWIPYAARRAACRAGGVLYGLYAGLLALPLFLTCCAVNAATARGRPAARSQRRFIRLFFRLAGLRIDVESLDRLGPDPVILVANHASYLDPLLLIAALPRHFVCVTKKEAFDWPLFGRLLRKAGHLAVERGGSAKSAADAAQIEAALRRGESVLVFAEGTFTRARGLRPFRLGAFKAAVDSGCAVVPVSLRGSRTVLPEDRWVLRRSPVSIVLGPPVGPAATNWQEIIRLRDATFAEILAHCGEPALDVVSAALPRAAGL